MPKFVVFETGKGALLGEFKEWKHANAMAEKYNDDYNKKFNKPPKKHSDRWQPITLFYAKEVK
jgi:hypothetical protein